MSINRQEIYSENVNDRLSESETKAMKKIQSIIKGWMLHLEEMDGWIQAPPRIRHAIRRAVIRVAWDSYKVGFLVCTKLE